MGFVKLVPNKKILFSDYSVKHFAVVCLWRVTFHYPRKSSRNGKMLWLQSSARKTVFYLNNNKTAHSISYALPEQKQSKTGNVDHFTDSSQYTGSSAQRFGADGKGLGKQIFKIDFFIYLIKYTF